MDTADESLELTDGRRTACGTAESDVVRDWKFMARRGHLLSVDYGPSIWSSGPSGVSL